MGVALNCVLHHAVSNYESYSVCSAFKSAQGRIFNFELSWEHSHVEEDVHKSNQVFTL